MDEETFNSIINFPLCRPRCHCLLGSYHIINNNWAPRFPSFSYLDIKQATWFPARTEHSFPNLKHYIGVKQHNKHYPKRMVTRLNGCWK